MGPLIANYPNFDTSGIWTYLDPWLAGLDALYPQESGDGPGFGHVRQGEWPQCVCPTLLCASAPGSWDPLLSGSLDLPAFGDCGGTCRKNGSQNVGICSPWLDPGSGVFLTLIFFTGLTVELALNC